MLTDLKNSLHVFGKAQGSLRDPEAAMQDHGGLEAEGLGLRV